jgi:hypothetical protein
MRLRHFIQSCAALALAAGVSAPALAHGSMHGEPGQAGMDMPPPAAGVPAWKADRPAPISYPASGDGPSYGVDPRAREAWLSECRRRTAVRDDGMGGVVIGGLLGGFAGNRIGGRHHRTTGTIAGAAVGAAVGMAVDKTEDRGRVRDECERYLDEYLAYQTQVHYGSGYPGGQRWAYVPAYAPAQGPGCACDQRPAMMAAPAPMRAQANCTETVEYEYVDVPVRPKVRYIPRRHAPDKRIRQ